MLRIKIDYSKVDEARPEAVESSVIDGDDTEIGIRIDKSYFEEQFYVGEAEYVIDTRGAAEDILIAEQVLTDFFSQNSIMCMDFADCNYMMKGRLIYAGAGKAAGKNRVQETAQAAIDNLSAKVCISEIKNFLIMLKNFTGLHEIHNVMKYVRQQLADDFKVDIGDDDLWIVPGAIGGRNPDGTEAEKELEITIIAAEDVE